MWARPDRWSLHARPAGASHGSVRASLGRSQGSTGESSCRSTRVGRGAYLRSANVPLVGNVAPTRVRRYLVERRAPRDLLPRPCPAKRSRHEATRPGSRRRARCRAHPMHGVARTRRKQGSSPRIVAAGDGAGILLGLGHDPRRAKRGGLRREARPRRVPGGDRLGPPGRTDVPASSRRPAWLRRRPATLVEGARRRGGPVHVAVGEPDPFPRAGMGRARREARMTNPLRSRAAGTAGGRRPELRRRRVATRGRPSSRPTCLLRASLPFVGHGITVHAPCTEEERT